MKAVEILEYLYSLDKGWMDFNNTVDTFKAGDPQSEIQGIAVGWQSYTWALKQAIQMGCNLFITHEPTFYSHFDKPEDQRYTKLPGYFEKVKMVKGSGMVILRCHDLWDQMPGIGITDSWAGVLGLRSLAVRGKYHQVYEIPETNSGDFARHVANAVLPLGQEAVEIIGPLDKAVRRVAIGTGAIASLYDYASSFSYDLAVCTDDATDLWKDGEYAVDQQIPVVIVNHATSEEAGIKNLASHLQGQFPHIPVRHIPQGCTYGLISPSHG